MRVALGWQSLPTLGLPREALAPLIVALTCSSSGLSHAEGAYAFGQGPNGAWSGGSGYNYNTAGEAQFFTRTLSRKPRSR
jgi:hypothetical protein